MSRIFKFPIDLNGTNELRAPIDAKVLSVQMQHGALNVWVLADWDNALLPRLSIRIDVVGTGHETEERFDEQYISTVIDGPFVWHFFVHTEEENYDSD